MCGQAGRQEEGQTEDTDLGDAWVGALDVLAGQVQPAGGVRVDGGAVVPQGAPSLSAAPAALKLPVRLQTHAAAVPLGRALVQVHCGDKRQLRDLQKYPGSVLFQENRRQVYYE